jgi:Ca-activated chloride channel family protein
MKGSRAVRVIGIAIIVVVGWVTSLPAAPPVTKTLAPYFLVEGEATAVDHFPLKATDVQVSVSGVIAEVTVKQAYQNAGERPLNAQYVFPASTRAAVHGMKMTIGEKVVTARIKEREAANAEFREAKASGKTASLLDQQRPNVFTMRLANIMPGDVVEIELVYTELLVPTDGVYEFVFPTVVGPRYSSQAEAPAPAVDRFVKSPYLPEGEPTPARFSITTRLSTGIPVQEVSCSSHLIKTAWDGDAEATITLDETEQAGGNRDYILRYRLAGREIASGLLIHEGPEENFFLLLAEPPQRVTPAEIPPREYLFVVDVSGSMHGYPLDVSKGLLRDLIGHLRETDAFNVVLFSGTSAILAEGSLPATAENVNRALAFIDRQQGGGGTELLAALRRAMAVPRREGFSRSIVLATDGYIDAEREVFGHIAAHLDEANLFAFGIGTSVNRYLIEGVAKAGLSEPFVVVNPEEAPAAAARFRRYVESPVLTGITLETDGFDAYAIEPAKIPDLFAERPIVVTGKWRGTRAGRIVLTGKSGTEAYRKEIDLGRTPPRESNAALPFLWARTRVGLLSDYGSRNPGEEKKAEITELGLKYNLLTAYTSFIAVHEEIRNPGGEAQNVKQPLPLPQGVSNLAVGGEMSSVPEPGLVWLLVLSAGMLGAGCVVRRFRGCPRRIGC